MKALKLLFDTRMRRILKEWITIMGLDQHNGKDLIIRLFKSRRFFHYIYCKETGKFYRGNLFAHFKRLAKM